MQQMDIDLLTLSGHKFGAPQGIGALIVRKGHLREPLISGGPQENGKRAGSENVAMLAGLGKAAELAELNLNQRRAYLLELRNFFEQRLKSIAGVQVFSEQSQRLPNTSYFSIPYYHGETLLMQLDQAGFELASGSACHSQVTRPSHVLKAMGVDDAIALNAVRVSFGVDNTCQQVDQLVDTIAGLIERLPAAMRLQAS
jgi:cysteine desulfurase